MKPISALLMLFSVCVPAWAQTPASPQAPADDDKPQRVSELRALVQQKTVVPQGAAGPHHLSPEQRAELRQLLRQAGKEAKP